MANVIYPWTLGVDGCYGRAVGWYDLFSRFYDASVEKYYPEARAAAAEALKLEPGHTVVDLPCGTGQSFDGLAPRLEDGNLIGLDASEGMLARARERVAANGWSNVVLAPADVRRLDVDTLARAAGKELAVDRVHVFLGLTAFPDWEVAFDRIWGVLRPGGRCVVVDVHAAQPGLQGRMVNLVARADIRRRCWEPLEAAAESFDRVPLDSRPEHGGQLYLATGTKPG